MKVEVNGELLYRKRLPNGSFGPFVHSRHLMIQLQKEQAILEQMHKLPKRHPTGLRDQSLHSTVKVKLLKLADWMKEEYKPVIRVHTLSNLKDTKELIVTNLKTRIIRKKMEMLDK